MKNTKLLILLAACCFSMVSKAQTIGPVVGNNLSGFIGGDMESFEMKPGFHAGVVVDMKAGTNMFFETGIIYSQKGVMFKDDNKLKFELAYLEIPFLPKYIARSGFNFYTGPYISFLMSSKLTYGSEELNLKVHTNSVDAGLKLGLGYQLANGLTLSANYGIGFVNVLKDATSDKMNNSVLGFSLACMFGGK